MKKNQIALTNLVKKLGYKNHTELANKIRDLLTEKEHFNKYIIDEDEQISGRPEKVFVSATAEILIDNLAILYAFPNVFGRAPKGKKGFYPPYHELKNIGHKRNLNQALLAHKLILNRNIERSTASLKNLPIFGNAILSQQSIDITKDSLRLLMGVNDTGMELLELGSNYQLGAWNEILELQNSIDNGEFSSIIYQRIGEKLKELGDTVQALDALKKSIELDLNNGISHAISAVILYKKLGHKKNDVYEAKSRSDFSGFIDNPISAEEYWINERIDDTYNSYFDVRSTFVSSAIEALFNWPDWGEHSKVNGNKNYFSHLNQDHTTNFKLRRGDLFLQLISEISWDEFVANETKCIEIIRSFQNWNPDINPLPNAGGLDLSLDDKVNMFKVLTWISEDDATNAIKGVMGDYFDHPINAASNLAFIKRPLVQQIFWKHIGKYEYTDLLNSLLRLEVEHKELDNLKQISQLYFMDIHNPLVIIEKKLDILYQYGGELPRVWLDDYSIYDGEISNALTAAMANSKGWESLLNHQLWQRAPYSHNLPHYMLTTITLCLLLELSFGIKADEHIALLQSFSKHEDAFQISVSGINTGLFNELSNRIKEKNTDHNLNKHLVNILSVIACIRENVDDKKLEECMYFG